MNISIGSELNAMGRLFLSRSARCFLLLITCFSPAIYSTFAIAECTWPGKDDFPPVQEPLPGSTVICTGVETGVFVSDVPAITVEVTEGASIGGVELLGDATTVVNNGSVRDDDGFVGFGVSQYGVPSTFTNYGALAPGAFFFGDGYTATNFGTITSTLGGDETLPIGAMFSRQTDAGTMTNGASAEAAGVIQTSGNYAAGILLGDPAGTNSIDNQAYLPEEGPLVRASISTTGFGSPGVYVTNDLSTGQINIDNSGPIVTAGGESPGISVYPLTEEIPFSDVVRITNHGYGSIVTNGSDSQGILAYAGDVAVTNEGGIETRQWNTAGIEVIGLASVKVVNAYGAPIVTQGTSFSPGIALLGGVPTDFGSAVNVGDISTLGAESPGIVVFGSGHAVISSCAVEPGCRATITTVGDGSAGIQLGVVEPGLGIDLPSDEGAVFNGGRISTEGAFAGGIDAIGKDNQISNDSGGELLTSGEASPGVHVVSQSPTGPGNTVSNDGHIATLRDSSSGVFAVGVDSTVWNHSTIETHGLSSSGVEIAGDHSYADNSGQITTGGDHARGMDMTGDHSGADNHGQITTSNDYAHGMDMTGDHSGADNHGQITTSGEYAFGMNLNLGEGAAWNFGTIETIGAYAHGVLYQASYLDPGEVIHNSGSIVTTGAGAGGIYALYSTYSIDNAGGISTSGDAAHGIRISSIDVVPVVEPHSMIANSGEVFVSGVDSFGVFIERKLLEETDLANTASGQITSNGIAIAGSEGFENVSNAGVIDGDVQLGGAVDTVINDGVINGDVQLGGSNDEFTRGAGSAVDGIVDGGEDDDDLDEDKLMLRTVSGNEVVDGSKFVNFEQTWVQGAGAVTLNGTLTTDLTTVDGVTLYVAGRLESLVSEIDGGGVKVIDGGVVAGDGIVGADVDVQPDGAVSPSSSIGTLTIEGGLFLNGGVLTFEANSVSDTDTLVVGGDAVLNAGFVDVILGFTPGSEDVLHFLVVQGTLDIPGSFGGIRGIAGAGSGVALGTTFTVDLGGTLYEGTVTSAAPVDTDGDGVSDGSDNCLTVANADQLDTDTDGFGNRCDCDFNQDNFCGGPDFTLFIGCFNKPTGGNATCEAADMNGDGFVGGPDFTLFIGGFNGPPGPGSP